jgi:magnesium chelatase family protein
VVEHAVVGSAVLTGATASAVAVEVHVSNGLPGFTIVGLPDAAVRESRDRVRAAILSTGLPWPLRRLTVNLAPARSQFGNRFLTRAFSPTPSSEELARRLKAMPALTVLAISDGRVR